METGPGSLDENMRGKINALLSDTIDQLKTTVQVRVSGCLLKKIPDHRNLVSGGHSRLPLL